MNGSDERDTSRRTFLKGMATVGSAAGFAVTPLAGRAQETGGRATVLRFGGETSGWQGRSPDEIQGETNPTLQLEAGSAYRFVWENVDGQPHNVVIVDAEGNELERTQLISEQGATQSLEFTATPEMNQYFCEAHPSSMRGDVEVAGEGGDGGTRTPTTANETRTPANGTQADRTTTARTTTGAQIPQDFDTQLTFTAQRFAETMAGSLDASFLRRNLDQYRDRLGSVLEAGDLTPDSPPSFRQVGQTGLAVESTLDGAGFYAGVRQFYPELTSEYVARVARRARGERAVTDVLGGLPTGQSPDDLLRDVERRSGAVAASLSPEYASFAPTEGVIQGGLITVRDAGRLLRNRRNLAVDMDACVGRAGQIGAGFLLVGRSVQSMLGPEGMTEQQAAVGVVAGVSTMALGDRRLQQCLRIDPVSTPGTTTVGNGTTTAEEMPTVGNGTTVGGETTTVGDGATPTGTPANGTPTNGTSNASSFAGVRSADPVSTADAGFEVLGILGGCAGLVGHLLSSDDG